VDGSPVQDELAEVVDAEAAAEDATEGHGPGGSPRGEARPSVEPHPAEPERSVQREAIAGGAGPRDLTEDGAGQAATAEAGSPGQGEPAVGGTAARSEPGQGVGAGEATAAANRGGWGEDLADPARLRAAVEAVLLVVDEPISPVVLAQVLGRVVPDVERALNELRDEYQAGSRGIDLREVAQGWRFYSRDDFASYVERFVLDGQQARLTQAALETLAVIAYRQPVTRSRISAIRGVSVDAVMRTLITRGLVEECGADPDTGGGLYRTTTLFLEKMGLRSLDELPSLAPLLPDTAQLDDVALST
jgi:segregation and condensation protein B